MMETESLEEQNKINLIFYHEKELKKVLRGASVHKVFSLSEIRHLRNNVILDYRHPDWFISKIAKKMLSNHARK